jgi:predicted S18 family serine protease
VFEFLTETLQTLEDWLIKLNPFNMTANELYQIMSERNQTWFTINELATITQTPFSEIEKFLNNSDLFVRSSQTSPSGEKLFSTRKEFTQKAKFYTKLMGAFKNRID